MAEHRAAITGALGRTADPDAPDESTPSPATVRGLALRLAFWILLGLGGIYTIATASWRHDDLFSVKAAFWAAVMVNAIWQGWQRLQELRKLRSDRDALPDRRS